MWPIRNMYIYSVSNCPLPPTSNPLSHTHVITYSCSTQSYSWTAWQRAVLSCYLHHHWYKCWFYIQYLLQTLFNNFQICWWLFTEALICWYLICCSSYHFSEGWKCHWGHQNLTRHDQHILYYEDSTKSTQSCWNESYNQAKIIFSL